MEDPLLNNQPMGNGRMEWTVDENDSEENLSFFVFVGNPL
jgi:hypothetical protein